MNRRRNYVPRETLFDQKIREAQEAGLFDNLPGAGKPLQFEPFENPDRDTWTSFQILKNAGVLPEWIECAKRIEALEEQLTCLQSEHLKWVNSECAWLQGRSSKDQQQARAGVESMQRRYLQRAAGVVDELSALAPYFNSIVPARFLEKPTRSRESRFATLESQFGPLEQALGCESQPLPAEEPRPLDGAPERLFLEEPRATDPASVPARHAPVIKLRAVRSSRPSWKGLPLRWLAALNPKGHHAELERNPPSEDLD